MDQKLLAIYLFYQFYQYMNCESGSITKCAILQYYIYVRFVNKIDAKATRSIIKMNTRQQVWQHRHFWMANKTTKIVLSYLDI